LHPDALEQLIANAQRVSSRVHYVWHCKNATPRFFQLLPLLQQLYRTDVRQEIVNHLLAPRSPAFWGAHFSELLHFAKAHLGRAAVFLWVDAEMAEAPLERMWALKKLGADALHFWPCKEAQVSSRLWAEFLEALFESWLWGGHSLREVEPVVSLLQEILCHEEGRGPSCASQSRFHVSIRPDGEVYTHSSAVGFALRLGNIYSDELFEMVASPQLLQLCEQEASPASPACGCCRWQRLCRTGALQTLFAPFSEASCHARQQLCTHIAERLKAHLPPSFPGLEEYSLSPEAR
jgi:radical SAM protein with 4Fe4S-binding SPASM domain